jgi:hypothetical protein
MFNPSTFTTPQFFSGGGWVADSAIKVKQPENHNES